MKRYFKVCVGIALVAIALLIVVFSVLNGQKNAESYKVGSDAIASIKSVVDVRNLTSVSATTQNGVITKIYEYQSASATADCSQYMDYLVEQNFILTNKEPGSGLFCFAKESIESGKILIIQISATELNYTITIQQGHGNQFCKRQSKVVK